MGSIACTQAGTVAVRRIEHGYGGGERRAGCGISASQVETRSMQETRDDLGREPQVFGFGVRPGERQNLQFAQGFIRVGAQKNGAGQQALDAIV